MNEKSLKDGLWFVFLVIIGVVIADLALRKIHKSKKLHQGGVAYPGAAMVARNVAQFAPAVVPAAAAPAIAQPVSAANSNGTATSNTQPTAANTFGGI